MTAKRWGAAAAVMALVIVAGLGWRYWHPAEDAGVLRLNGTVDIRQVDLSFRVEGRLQNLAVEEGDRVRAGQTVATIDPGYLEDVVRIAQARVAAQSAQLAKLEAGNRPQEIAQARADVARAEATWANAKATYDRRAALPIDSAISRQSLDDVRAAMRQAEAQLARAREALALQEKGFRVEEITAGRAQLEAEQATLDLMRRRLGDAVLTSPSDGTIMTRVREPGSMMMPGATVATLALTDPMQIRTWVPETALGKVVPGAVAEIVTDSQPGRIYHGQVGFISPVAEFTPKSVETQALRTSLVYRVRIIVADPDDHLRQGMPVTVRLAVGRG